MAQLVEALRYSSRKVAGSIPDGATRNFRSHNPSGRTMALVVTQPLTETYHLHVPIVLKSGSLQPTGPVKACPETAAPLPLPLYNLNPSHVAA